MIPPRARILMATLAISLGAAAPGRADHAWAPVLTIDAESARTLVDRGERVHLVDLRPAVEVAGRRLPGARSMPLAELRERVHEVPRTGIVVIDCACPRDELLRAYQFLRGRQYRNVFVLEGGIDQWMKLGHRLER